MSADRTLNPSDNTLVLFTSHEDPTPGASNPPKLAESDPKSSTKEEDKGVFNFNIDEEPSQEYREDDLEFAVVIL